MKTKHTPGPWSYDRAPQDYDGAGSPAYSTITAENGEIVIAEVNDLIPSGLANAHLAAAAPSLLEFAVRVRNTTSSTRIKREATAVIAEARANFPD